MKTTTKKPSTKHKAKALNKHDVGNSAHHTMEKKVNEKMRDVIKILIKFCQDEYLTNPKISMIAEVENGAQFRLVFQRTDLD